MKLSSVVKSDLSISTTYILFRLIMFFPTKSCWKTTLFFSILVQSWAILHIPRYISSSRLRLSNFFIPFERLYAGEVFYLKSSAGSLCVFPGERLKKCPKFDFFWDALSTSVARVGVTKIQKLVINYAIRQKLLCLFVFIK